MNLLDINKRFPTEKAALDHLAKVRWGENPTCPYCGSDRVTNMPGQLRYHCNAENRSYSVRANSIFEESRLDIRKWFYGIALMMNAKKGLSAMQFSRDVGVTYKTAWYCLMRIRCALADQEVFLHSIVQVDEAFVGGKPRKGGNAYFTSLKDKNKRGRGTKKAKVVVMVEQRKGGKAIAKMVPNLTSQQLTELLKKNIHQKQSIVVTDKYRGYNKLDQFFNHITIEHSEEFSKNGINLNKAEGFIGLLKRGLIGQYHKLSMKYLPFYLAEFTFRYNHNLDKKVWDKAIELSIEKNKCMLRYKCDPSKPVKVCDI
jgi:transposase-like protein